MRNPVTTFLLVLLACVVTGCGGDVSGEEGESKGDAARVEPATVPELNGTSFVSTNVSGHRLVPGSAISISFSEKDLGLSAGCNSMGGTYRLVDGKLTGTRGFSTQMFCGDELNQQERWLGKLLAGGVEAGLADGKLILEGDDGLRIELVEEEETLIGTTWELDSTGSDGPGWISVGARNPPTMKLTPDDAVQVFTGCNSGHGRARVEGDFIDFGPIRLTRKACPGKAGKVEQTMMRTLEGKVFAELDGTDLELQGATQLFFVASALGPR